MILKFDESGRPWWQGATIYQVYPRSFLDTNGDGIGDLPGVVDRLEHIASLGVDAVWISPFFTSPMRDFGYDISDYTNVDPSFGTLADYDRLLEKAHSLGLKVIIDQVYSHTSDEHAWFLESRETVDNPKADWYVWADPKEDGAPPNNWQSVFGGPAWEWNARRQQYYLHNFLPSQPDLNVRNPAVQDAIFEVARFWLDRGTDGFRLDAINFAMHDPSMKDNPPAKHVRREDVTRPFDMQLHSYNQSHSDIPPFLERLRGLLDSYGGKFTVAEVGGPDPYDEMHAFTAENKRLNSAYSFDFLYARELTANRVRESLSHWPGTDEKEGWPAWAFSNHDAPRALSRWSNNTNTPELAGFYSMVLASLRGLIFLYQGEELGLGQAHVPFEHLQDPEAIANWPRTLGRDGARTPLPWQSRETNAGFSTGKPWLPVDEAHLRLSVDLQENDDKSALNFTRKIIRTRQENAPLRHGHLTVLDSPGDILALERTTDTERVVCVFNLGKGPITWKPALGPDARIVLTAPTLSATDLPDTLEPNQGYWVADKR